MAIRSDALELAVRFVTTGQRDLDQAAAGVEKITRATQNSTAPLRQFADQLEQTGQSSFQFFGSLSRGAAIAGGVAAGIGVIGKAALDLVGNMGAAAEQSLNFADRLGISVGQAERLQAAARIAGVNVGSLEGAARTLSNALEDSAGGGAKTAQALAQLGVQTRTVSGAQRDMGLVLLDTLAALGQVENTSQRTFLAMRTLPRGAAVELLPLIKNFDELNRTVAGLGVGLDEGLIRRLADADDEIGKLSEAWAQFKKELAGKIAPIVIPIVAGLTLSRNESSSTSGQQLRFADASISPATQGLNLTAPRIGDEFGLRVSTESVNQSIADGQRLADAFRKNRSTTEAGQRALLGDLRQQLQDLESQLVSGSLSRESFLIKQQEFRQLEAQRAQTEARIKAFEDSRKPRAKPDTRELDLARSQESFLLNRLDIRQTGDQAFAALAPSLTSLRGNLPFFASPVQGGGSDAAFGEGLIEADRRRTELAKERAAIENTAAVRLLELSGRELEAAQRLRDFRVSTATTVLEVRQAELDLEVRIAEIARQRNEEAREAAGRVFDSLVSGGGGGIRDLGRGLLRQQERALFQNASAGLFQTAGSVLGRVGEASGLGSLLRGTLFDPKNAQQPIDRNTTAVEKLTTTLERQTGILTSGGGAGIFGSDVGGLTGRGGLARIFGGGSSGGGFLGGLGSVLNGGGLFGLGGGSIQLGEGRATTLQGLGRGARIGNAVGSGLALVGGGLAIASGIQEGGARGALGAISGGLAIAGTIPGPQQPFIQAAALVAGFVKALIPSKSETFGREQDALLNARRTSGPEAIAQNFDFATGSDAVGFDWRGRVRVIVNRVINVNIDALDARSVIERGDDIAEAVRQQVEAGHPINAGIQNAVFGMGAA